MQGAMDLFDFANEQAGKPKTKKKPCNQLGCENEITLYLDKDEGIYTGNRTCFDCSRSYRWKMANWLR